ncbi:GtrA family protein [Filimonas effusa]|uniref:GtrA family protein n=1 Tax=Filimonas effusa TaxID=2508721 RepID=A0A4Q1D3G5_9BACT|nr:GtrA family protein [Filimonas effusa]
MAFLKAQVTSLSATLVDYSTTLLLAYVCYVNEWYAGMAGSVAGGLFHFTVSRRWVFNAADKNRYVQMVRYMIVWAGNFFLNTGGLYIMLHYTPVDLAISKILVSVVVGIGYNYVLQKKFVFK